MGSRDSLLWEVELKFSLQALASPPDIQVRIFGGGACVTCELLENFEAASNGYSYEHRYVISPEQHRRLVELQHLIESLDDKSDLECFNNDLLCSRKPWSEIRQASARALKEFGWPVEPPPREVGTGPGIVERERR